MTSNLAIELNELKVGYWGKTLPAKLFPVISISALKGELIALVGRNGVGKSTLLRSISKLQPVMAGSINLFGRKVDEIDRFTLSRLISFIPAEPVHAPNMSVVEFVSLARYPYHGWFEPLDEADKQIVSSALENVGILHLGIRELESLSDGERQRAMIAFAIAQDTEIILMDEPTAFLDLPTKFDIVRLLKDFSEKGKTIIFSTHDLHTSFREVDTFWLMLNDEVISGSPEELALNGSFNRFFAGTNISLDIATGNFETQKKYRTQALLIGENEVQVFWTKHALERIGIEAISRQDVESSAKSGIPAIQCICHNQRYSWNYRSGNNHQVFEKISDLSRYCKFNR